MSDVIVNSNNRIFAGVGALNHVEHDNNLSGLGTIETPLGLSNDIKIADAYNRETDINLSGTQVKDASNSAKYGASAVSIENSTGSVFIDANDVSVIKNGNTYSLTGATPFTGIRTDNNFVGNGTPVSSLHLNSAVVTTWSVGAGTDANEHSRIFSDGLTVTHTANGVGGGVTTSTYGETYDIMFNDGEQYLKKAWLTKSGYSIHDYNHLGNGSAFYGPHSASFHDGNGQVYYNADSIRKWDEVTNMNHDSNISGNATTATPLGLNSSISLTRDDWGRTARMEPARFVFNESLSTAWYYAGYASFETNNKSGDYYAGFLRLADDEHTTWRTIDPETIDQWNSINHIRVTAEGQSIDISKQSWCVVSFDEGAGVAYIHGKNGGTLNCSSGHWYMFGDAKKNGTVCTHLIASGNTTTTYI